MQRSAYYIIFLFLFVFNSFCNWNLAYDCYLNYNDPTTKMKVAFHHFNFFMKNRSTNVFETSVVKLSNIKVKNDQGQLEECKRIALKPNSMNTMFFLQDGITHEILLGNMMTRKFHYFNIEMVVKDTDLAITSTESITKDVLVNSSNYVSGYEPTFEFTHNNYIYKVRCEISDPNPSELVKADDLNMKVLKENQEEILDLNTLNSSEYPGIQNNDHKYRMTI